MKYVRKRNGKLEPYDKRRIQEAIWKASQSVGNQSKEFAYSLGEQVHRKLYKKYGEDGVPTVEEIQDTVEKVLIKRNLARVAKAYILYRKQHEELRNLATMLTSLDLIDSYLNKNDWKVKENANRAFSLQGLNNFVSTEITRNYWLNKIYPPKIRKAHESGDFHIHTLNLLSVYCVGWDLYDLLATGFRGPPGKIASRPPKHFRTALGQLVNFLFSLQQEAAGAQAVSDIDVLLAPYIRHDRLSYRQVKQCLQEFVYNMNVSTRVGGETPFSNVTLALKVPSYFHDVAVLLNGSLTDEVYDSFQDEIDMFNRAFFEVMEEGDALHRVFTFPIPTYNITRDLEWDNEILEGLWRITAKYGIPYFSNFINSEMKVEDARSMCCRLRLDTSKLDRKGGGYFGANALTGSIGVVTINMPRIGYLAKDDNEYFEKLSHLMELAKNSLEIKRKVLERFTEKGLYPYTKFYLRNIKARFNKYWKNHFSTIGLVGMNESLLNFMGCNIGTKEGIKFTLKVLDFMRERLLEFQNETGNLYNLEATPAESTCYRLALLDKEKLKNPIFANGIGKKVKDPFYTNSTQLPVNYTEDIFEALELQDEIQTRYTGGTVLHLFIGEQIHDYTLVKKLVRTICEGYRLPYFTITPTFSICPEHGYINGEVPKCPKCNMETEVYSRIVGYLRPVSQWNKGKKAEYRMRKVFKVYGTSE